jgi:hypothetical protein
MSEGTSNSDHTGADLLGIEVDRETKARIMTRLRERQAVLQLELAGVADLICRAIEARLDAIEKALDQ